MAHLCHIGLGSNLGDRRSILDGAVASLASSPGIEVRRVSSYVETDAVGGPEGQGSFLNAAATVETSLPPAEVLRITRRIERDAGRVRRVRWGERTLDLDLLLFDQLRVETEELNLPHPWMALRRFVLAPLAEIAPGAIHPTTGRTVRDLLGALDLRRVALLGWGPSALRRLARRVPQGWTVLIEADLPAELTFAAAPSGVDVSRLIPDAVPLVVADEADERFPDDFAAACHAAS